MRILAALLLACGFANAQIADAVQNRDSEAFHSLLKQKININATQPDGTTALHWAAHWNDLDAVNLLLRAGANPKIANRCCFRKGSSAVAVGDFRIGSGAQKKVYSIQIVPMRRPMESCGSVRLRCVDVDILFQQRMKGFAVAIL